MCIRDSSIYYADKVIPMLPKELSNGICSLNPNESRLTFSAIMELSKDGILLNYKFVKSVICSKVKGIYSEINSILDGSAEKAIEEKYFELKAVSYTHLLGDLQRRSYVNVCGKRVYPQDSY